MANEIATTSKDNVLPAYMASLSKAYENAGLEQVRQGDIQIPRMALMQALSPEVADEGKFRAGDLVDSIAGTLIAEAGKPVRFIVIRHLLQWIKWKPRTAGGGVVELSYDATSALAKAYATQDLKLDAKVSEVIVEYHNFVVILPDINASQMLMISCGKTNWKHGKNLISRMKMRGGKAPAFAGVYTVQSANETNKNQQTYKVFNFENAGWCSEAEFDLAKAAYDSSKDVTVVAHVDAKESDASSGLFNEKEL